MSWAMWITGPPGSGKSLLARRVADALRAKGLAAVRVLELDEVRPTVTPEPTFSAEEGEVVYRALIAMAAELVAIGVPVLIDATAHRWAWRELARTRLHSFAEIQLECPVQVCREREQSHWESHGPRGIYTRAGRPGATVPGIDVPYEPAVAPELRLRTDLMPVDDMVGEIVAIGAALAAPVAAPAAPDSGGVLWITGRPGTGKTTLARALIGALEARGVQARMLSLAEFERAVDAHRLGVARGRELAHRALAYTAKLLAEAGLLVVVDDASSRRTWREVARRLAPRFIEVELVCAPEICETRERAARWGLWPDQSECPEPAVGRAADATPEHEHADHPEVRVQTGVESVGSAVQDVLRAIVRIMGRPLVDRLADAVPGSAHRAEPPG
jgi:adenylylsulfate kinase